MIDWKRTVRVGGTDLFVPRIGLGTASLGNLLVPVSDDEAVGVIRSALDAGIRFIDTAPLYGHGLAEQRVARAISGWPREELVLSTKVGRLLREGAPPDESQYHQGEPFYRDVPSAGPVWDFSETGIRTSVAESARRVGVERFDILHLHDPDDHYLEASTTGYQALDALRREDSVAAIGAGMNHTGVQTRLVRHCDLDVVLVAGRYTLLDQTAMNDLLPACVDRGVSVVIGGVFNSGVLVEPSPGARFDYVPASDEVVERARLLQGICRAHGVPLAAAALQFPLAHPRVCSVLLGPRSIAELETNLRLLEVDIPSRLWRDLIDDGLIRDDAPVPA
ncbi:aldo/keto reductase [Actinospica sp.]|jgi:D-threo-aldose 1-dehydrogenase|uniref:aldo/keto reductase n=1 Tax=Actinospica sp. TaxID=1872142 RepID=UPI002C66B9DC|nr:aldo/keto reductase [Actinospica sp.]HWG26345.1 aldo/keto reductase [Actinospica sp.]